MQNTTRSSRRAEFELEGAFGRTYVGNRTSPSFCVEDFPNVPARGENWHEYFEVRRSQPHFLTNLRPEFRHLCAKKPAIRSPPTSISAKAQDFPKCAREPQT